MDEITNHQRLLMEIRDKLCDGNASELARRIGKDSTYVNRLFYPAGKRGRKGIGLEIMQSANTAFHLPPGFWDLDPPVISPEIEEYLKGKRASNQALFERMERFRGPLAEDDIPSFLLPHQRVTEPPAAYSTMQPILAWEHEDDLPPGEFIMVPRLEVRLSAGNGAGSTQVEIEFNEQQPQAFRAEWVRGHHLKPKKLAAMTADGNSMEPTIHDGDSLLVDTSQTEVIDGKVYALWYEGGERVKRLYRMPGGGLRIRSDNAVEHPEIVLAPEYVGHVRIIGRVVHRSGTGGL